MIAKITEDHLRVARAISYMVADYCTKENIKFDPTLPIEFFAFAAVNSMITNNQMSNKQISIDDLKQYITDVFDMWNKLDRVQAELNGN